MRQWHVPNAQEIEGESFLKCEGLAIIFLNRPTILIISKSKLSRSR